MITSKALRAVLFSLLMTGFAVASGWSLRVACADYWFRRQTPEATAKAIAITPGRADYFGQLSLLLPSGDLPGATTALQRAVQLNPSDARWWIELGLRYEEAGNGALAEQCLLRASREDVQYLPRWTLMNYYYRTRSLDRFWFWARQAAEIVPGDPAPFFRLCGKVAEDGALIDRLNIRRANVITAYLYYLLAQGRPELAAPASRKLLAQPRDSDIPLLVAVCEHLLGVRKIDEALAIWNPLADAHRIPFGRLRPAEGDVLTNGDFRSPPSSQGFDWRLQALAGITASADEGIGLRMTFAGNQPENCEPLVQLVPVQENMAYDFKVAYRTAGIAAGSGLEWRITDSIGNPLGSLPNLSAEQREGSGTTHFVAPTGCRLARVALGCRRIPGTTRTEGFIVLRKVTLTARFR